MSFTFVDSFVFRLNIFLVPIFLSKMAFRP